MAIFVISKYGERLMPTVRYGKVRHLLKEGKATIYSRNPFTIQLTYETTAYTQPIEVCQDTGYLHIGLSVKSEAREYVSAEYDLLPNEKEKHDDQRRYRKTRRNRLRYRAPRFDNRKASKPEGWIAPSLRNKADRHIELITNIAKVAPVTSVTVEVGEFDTQVLKAVDAGDPIPKGIEYQYGPGYGFLTQRLAIFQRDHYKCVFCGRGIEDGAILETHHAFFWKGRHGDRMDEQVTCCTWCHTPANHQEDGLLCGFDEKLEFYDAAAFMNTVRWDIYNNLKKLLPDVKVNLTYGAATNSVRKDMGLDKTHAIDAYVMGNFHPDEMAETLYFEKRRRNNRILEKFYDAKYIDIRDGSKKSGAQLGCQRTKRKEARMSDKNLRIYHVEKVSKGRRSIRTKRYNIRPGDLLLYDGKLVISGGTHNNGTRVMLNGKSVAISKVKIIKHVGAWVQVT